MLWLLPRLSFSSDAKDLFCWYKRKKWFLWTMAATQTAENHGEFYTSNQWEFYTSVPNWAHSQYSWAAEAPSLKICYHVVSFKWSQNYPSQQKKSLVVQWKEASLLEFEEKLVETETTKMIRKWPAEQILGWENRRKSKEQNCESHSQESK